ncbi:MAG TPA: NlpC/P60 family protein [Mycobacteriales bacterium]|nr:NlpC/P60 family protein [Mycobacteriales bacterium]
MPRPGKLIRTAVVTLTAGLAVTLVPHAAYARPHDPGDGAITAAQQAKNRKAAEVGRLTGLVAKADGDATRAQDRAELAVEKYNKAVVDLDTATRKAAKAKADVARSAKAVATARRDFSKFARNSYMQGSTVGSATTALLDAESPSDLLQRADLLTYAGRHKLDVIGQIERTTVRKANSESTARQLLAAQQEATERANRLKIEAAREVADAQAKLATLRTQKAALNAQLEAARIRLNGLYAERARYRAWKKAQEEAAAREAARLRKVRAEAAARAAAAARAEAAAARSSSSRSSSSSSSSRSSGSSRSSVAPRFSGGGGWSAAKGQRVADIALRWLGTPYSWGGGTTSGPTWGQGGPVGFDCSGLALWAWGQVGVYLPHYSGYQFNSGPHISRSNLRPGDLVFWAYNTSDPGSIHHVAIYIGGGRIVQAPQTGDVVKISYMWSSGYIGAARPGA